MSKRALGDDVGSKPVMPAVATRSRPQDRLESAKAAVKKIGACSFHRLVRLHGHEHVRSYLSFLVLKAVARDFDATLLSPMTGAVNKTWHAHVLDTKHYRETCAALCGKFIEHDPDGEVNAYLSGRRDARRQLTTDLTKELEPVLDAIRVSPAPPTIILDGALPNDANTIRIKIATKQEVHFLCRQTTLFQELMDAFCQDRRLNSVRFLYDDIPIAGDATPYEMQMDQDDGAVLTVDSSWRHC